MFITVSVFIFALHAGAELRGHPRVVQESTLDKYECIVKGLSEDHRPRFVFFLAIDASLGVIDSSPGLEVLPAVVVLGPVPVCWPSRNFRDGNPF